MQLFCREVEGMLKEIHKVDGGVCEIVAGDAKLLFEAEARVGSQRFKYELPVSECDKTPKEFAEEVMKNKC